MNILIEVLNMVAIATLAYVCWIVRGDYLKAKGERERIWK